MLPYYNDVDATRLTEEIERMEKEKISGEIKEPQREDFVFELRDGSKYAGLVCAASGITQSGQIKTGKSRVGCILEAAAIHPKGHYYDHRDMPPLAVCHFEYGMNVLKLDSELSPFEFGQMVQGVCRAGGFESVPEHYHAMSVKSITDKALRTAILRNTIKKYAESRRGLGLLVIDVGSDFVDDINDRVQSLAFWDMVGSMMTKYKFCLNHIMHQNKNDKRAAGEFGHYAGKKCSFIASVERNTMNDDQIFYTTEDRRTSEKFDKKTFVFSKTHGLPVEVFKQNSFF